jgi:hypothetical protein
MKMKLGMKNVGLLAALAITVGSAGVSLASIPLAQNLAPSIQQGGQGSDCPGPFTGYSIMTNSTGSTWITPPTGATNGILTDISGFPSPYASVASVVRKSDLSTWCAGNYVQFPVSSGDRFQLKLYVVSALPTNTPLNLTLQIQWQ